MVIPVGTLFHSHLASARCRQAPRSSGNRLNGFHPSRHVITWLKPGVNKKKPLLGQSQAAPSALTDQLLLSPVLIGRAVASRAFGR